MGQADDEVQMKFYINSFIVCYHIRAYRIQERCNSVARSAPKSPNNDVKLVNKNLKKKKVFMNYYYRFRMQMKGKYSFAKRQEQGWTV